MRLREYLDTRGESPGEFARRAGVDQAIIQRLYDEPGASCTVPTGLKIIAACRQRRAPGRKSVSWRDLAPAEDDSGAAA